MSAAYGQSRPASEAPRELGNLKEQVRLSHERFLQALKAEQQALDRYEDAKDYSWALEKQYLTLNSTYMKLMQRATERHHRTIDELERKRAQNRGK